MEENLQENTQETTQQNPEEKTNKIKQIDRNTLLLVVACSLICFLLGLLLGNVMGGSKSSSQQQPLYQRPPLNGSANFGSQDRFAGQNAPRPTPDQRQRPQLQGNQQQAGGNAPHFQRQQRQFQGNEQRQRRQGGERFRQNLRNLQETEN